MNVKLIWTIRPFTATLLEAKIEEDAENRQFFFPCHRGPVTHYLTLTGNFLDCVKGLAVCRCGARLGMLNGAIDGTHITLRRF